MIALYFAIYYLLALGITRVRAEVGPPTHEMFVANPRQFIIDSFGSRMIPPPSLTMMSLYFAFNRGVSRAFRCRIHWRLLSSWRSPICELDGWSLP